VEYINRLLGALAGIACILTFILSFGFRKENRKLVLLTLLICFLMGFQAWLGKTVVDSVLNPFKITTHMLAALLIVSLQLIVIYAVQKNKKWPIFNLQFKRLLLVALTLTIVQIILGTTVREHVDMISESGAPEIMWLQNPTIAFYIHRSFSIVVLLTNVYLFYINRKLDLGFSKINWVIALLFIEIITGISMYYFAFPFGTQTVHVVLATILFGIQFYTILESNTKKAIL
jgi:cytochrome c oxidase assembly protein subunit 15